MDPFGLLALLIPYAGMATGVFVMVLIYKGVTKLVERRGVADADQVIAELSRLRAEVDAVSDAVDRVQELEERVDFAERMLAQQRHDRLTPET